MVSEKTKPMSIVTAFFDIGRGEIGEGYPDYLRRTNDTYFEHFSRLAVLENEMVVFTSEEHRDRIDALREGKPTKIIVIELKKKFRRQIKAIEKVQKSEKFRSRVNKDMLINIEYWLNSMEDVYSAIFNNTVYIIVGSIIGSPKKWKEFYRLLRNNQNELLKENVIDDDQGLYMMSIFKRPDKFHSYYLLKISF